ncbi:MFS transporter [Propionibacteriaceae bacterium Y1700]|uniref:MFS transporter n=1 Tax=Microlunatus sp. Y1700 TaxID=3418487 RepID=UPI003DA72F7F
MSAPGIKQWIRKRTTLPRSVLVLSVISFTVAVGFGVMLPVLPVFAKSFDVGTFGASAVVSAFALMRLVFAPAVGPLINKFGERPVLSIGILIVAVSTAVSALSQSYLQFLVLRGLGGVGSAMFTVSSMTLVLNTVAPQIRGRAVSLYQGGFLLGGMAGPAIGGLLSGISLTAPFFFYAGGLVVAGAIGLVTLRSTGKDVASRSADVRPMPQVLRDSRFQAALIAGLGQGWTSFGVRSALIPLLMVEVLHEDPKWTGITFAVAAVVQTVLLVPAGRFVDTVGRRPAMLWGGLVCGAAALAIPFSPSVWVLMIIVAVYGAGSAFLGTAPAAAVGDAAGGRGGTPVAVFSMITDAGAIVGPLVAGLLAQYQSYPLAFAVGAMIFFLGSAMSLRMPRYVPDGPAPATEGGDRRRSV